ncbi:hypothetical protein ILUMI_18379 [Ignelater luminosus]|uniref:Uncharacterized protein n=1 Tax=Ignelater luminosus TaxID=2038154 RepID=A0A8K0CNP9_IGNLU|nr:hypothetical protein ILUMI_18379 [Ignelater luminosus]
MKTPWIISFAVAAMVCLIHFISAEEAKANSTEKGSLDSLSEGIKAAIETANNTLVKLGEEIKTAIEQAFKNFEYLFQKKEEKKPQ